MPQIFSVGARSVLVNTIAWLGICLALLSAISPLVRDSLLQMMGGVPAAQALALLPDEYRAWLIVATMVLALTTLVAAIGLLLRLNWARLAFIGLLLMGIVANLLGLWLQQEIVQSVVSNTLASAALPESALSALGGLATASKVLGALMTTVLCVALAWIIYRLMSQAVRQEFG